MVPEWVMTAFKEKDLLCDVSVVPGGVRVPPVNSLAAVNFSTGAALLRIAPVRNGSITALVQYWHKQLCRRE
jgi:hypothetical protein